MGVIGVGPPKRRTGGAVVRFVVAALSALLLVALAGLTIVEVRPEWLAGLRNAVPAPAPVAALPGAVAAPRAPAAPARRGAARPAGRATTLPGQDVAAVGAPRLVALVPTSGGAGQRLVVSGVNLFSADGRITLRFGRRAAPVRCPSTRRCVATVPPLDGPPRTMPVEMRTSGGQSNTLAFHYR